MRTCVSCAERVTRSVTKPKTTHFNQSAGRSAARLTTAGALALTVGLGGAGAALAAPAPDSASASTPDSASTGVGASETFHAPGGPTDLCAPHPKRSLSISDDFVYEHENAVLWVELSGPACYYVNVDYATTGFGTAQAGSDYVAESGTLTFAPGTTKKSIVIDVKDDDKYESNETFYVQLSDPVAADISDSWGKVTISGAEPRG